MGYIITYTTTGVGDKITSGNAFALELDAARDLRATVKFAPGTAAVVSDE